MTGGLIQLVAYGQEDLFLTRDPQITFFKTIYRRHTNFSTEETEQSFLSDVNFGGKYVCLIPHDGDLIDGMSIKLSLPEIPILTTQTNSLTRFAWVRNIGFAVIKSIEIEINGRIIDRHYGEWMYLFSRLTTQNLSDGGLDRLVGNVPEMYEFTNGKPSYTMYIPLYFWFCRNSGSAIPVIALQYSDIRVNLELEDFENCYMLSPSQYIQCNDDIVTLQPYEYLTQILPDGSKSYGMFSYYDIQNKLLYYIPIGTTKFVGNPNTTTTTAAITTAMIDALYNPSDDITHIFDYLIQGTTSKYYVTPTNQSISVPYSARIPRLRTLVKNDTSLLVNFVYLDEEERYKFAQTKQDYLIEKLYYTNSVQIDSANKKVRLNIDQPCKLIIWVPQLQYIAKYHDWYNYTDTHERDQNGNLIGNPLILQEKIMLNSIDRTQKNNHQYYESVQPFYHSGNALPIGTGMYSFAIFPLDTQPSGTTNMSQIELIELMMRMNNRVNQNNRALIRAYSLCYNILRVNNGLCATVFT